MAVKNVIFDWNGTLVDDFLPVCNAINNILAYYGKGPASKDFIRENYKANPLDFYKIFNISMSREKMLELLTRFMSEESLPLVHDSVIDAVKKLENLGVNLFIVSSCPKETLLFEIERSGLSAFFPSSCILGGSIDKSSLINSIGLDPKETLIVGDTFVDIEAGKLSGIKTAAYLKGYQSEDMLKMYDPDFMISHINEILSLL